MHTPLPHSSTKVHDNQPTAGLILHNKTSAGGDRHIALNTSLLAQKHAVDGSEEVAATQSSAQQLTNVFAIMFLVYGREWHAIIRSQITFTSLHFLIECALQIASAFANQYVCKSILTVTERIHKHRIKNYNLSLLLH